MIPKGIPLNDELSCYGYKLTIISLILFSSSERKYLKRGLSKTTENIKLVSQLREHVKHDIITEVEPTADAEPSSPASPHCAETPEYTFILPDLTIYEEDFRAFLHKELIEMSTLVSLQNAG